MHGLETNEEKEDEFDFVWVGSATNHASKYADVAIGSSVFISDACYENIKAIDKSAWEKKTCNKGRIISFIVGPTDSINEPTSIIKTITFIAKEIVSSIVDASPIFFAI